MDHNKESAIKIKTFFTVLDFVFGVIFLGVSSNMTEEARYYLDKDYQVLQKALFFGGIAILIGGVLSLIELCIKVRQGSKTDSHTIVQNRVTNTSIEEKDEKPEVVNPTDNHIVTKCTECIFCGKSIALDQKICNSCGRRQD